MNQFIARSNFEAWTGAVHSENPKRVAELFCERAIFLPTLSGKMRSGPEEAEDYFRHFLEKRPTCSLVEDKFMMLSDKAYCHTGIYEFVIDESGKRVVVPARFSFIWSYEEEIEWRILHFHSSLRPS